MATPTSSRPRPLVLVICDGWGVAPPGEGNAIALAKKPNFDRMVRNFPAVTLIASGTEVGLSWGEMGNSEVGHLNIGAGRVYYQTFPRINKEISSGEFFKNPALLEACTHAKKHKSALHLSGILSPGNVHGAEDHLYALLELAKQQGVKEVKVHVILDGRDAKFDSGKEFVARAILRMKKIGVGQIASLAGRKFAMDRDNRWEQVEKAYRAMTGEAPFVEDPIKAIEASYGKKVYDEEFEPVTIAPAAAPVGAVKDNDAVIFWNFRPDRARELTKAFVLPGFDKFERKEIKNLFCATFAEYEKDLPVSVAWLPETIKNCLAEVIAAAGLKQYHIAETEKYAHITFFLNGTIEDPFPGEERKIIPSPKVSNYAETPEMSAEKLGAAAVKAIESDKYDCIFMNFANADMVGHTGNLKATIKGIEAIDRALGPILDLTLAKGGALMFTADHGNAEEVINLQTGEIDKEHATNPVPFIVCGKAWQGQSAMGGEGIAGDLSLAPPVGMLADVAPTILKILGLKAPEDMTGRSLI